MRRVDGVARQHRHQPQEQRQLAVAGAGEVEADRSGVGRLDPPHLPEGLALLRPALGLQQIEGEAHVVGRDRRAVREARAGIEVEGREGAGVVGVQPPRDEAVEREGLVLRARHQGLEDHRVQPLGGRAGLEVEGVQAVEGAEQAQAQPSALGRIRVGVGEMGEVVGQGGGAVHGDRRRRAGAGRAAERGGRAAERGGRAAERDREGEGDGTGSAPREGPGYGHGDHLGTRCWCGCDRGRRATRPACPLRSCRSIRVGATPGLQSLPRSSTRAKQSGVEAELRRRPVNTLSPLSWSRRAAACRAPEAAVEAAGRPTTCRRIRPR